jgi:hypothetical protein
MGVYLFKIISTSLDTFLPYVLNQCGRERGACALMFGSSGSQVGKAMVLL